MNSKLSRILHAGAALLLALPAAAMAQNGAAAQAAGVYNFRFSVIAMAPEKADMGTLEQGTDLDLAGISYETGGVTRPLGVVPFHSRSKSFLYRGNDALSFFRESSNAEGERVRELLAEVTPDRSWRSVVILAYPGMQGAEKSFRAEAIPDDPRTFPENSVYLANRSGSEITLLLDGQRHTVSAGSDLRLPIPLSEARMLPMQFFAAGASGSRPTYSTSLPLRPGQRLLILLQSGTQTPLRIPPVFLSDRPGQTLYDDFDPAKAAKP